MKILKKLFNKDYDRGIEPDTSPPKRPKRKVNFKSDSLAPKILEKEVLSEASTPSQTHRSGRPRQVYREIEGKLEAFDFPVCSTGYTGHTPFPMNNRLSEEALKQIIRAIRDEVSASTQNLSEFRYKTNKLVMK